MSIIKIPTKRSTDIQTRGFDFADRLTTGITLSSATATVTDDFTGQDVTNSLLSSGTGSVTGSVATFTIQGGVSGRTYTMVIRGVLSNSDDEGQEARITVRD